MEAPEQELRRGLLSTEDRSEYEMTQKLRHKKTSSGEERVLSLWEKWTAHGRFPYKMTLHVALLLLTFTQMQLFDAQNSAYIRASHRNWAFFFLPPADQIGVVPRFQRELYTINSTMTAVHYLRNSYFSVGNASVANYEYLHVESGEIQPLSLTDDETVGPFDPNMTLWQKNIFFRSLQSVKFTFALRDHQFGNLYEECFEWHISVGFQVIESAQIHVQLEDCEVFHCSSMYRRQFWTTAIWINVVVAVVSFLYMTLNFKALGRSFQVVRARTSLMEHARREEKVKILHDVALADSDGESLHCYTTLHDCIRAWFETPFRLKLKLLRSLHSLVVISLVLLIASTLWSLFTMEAHIPIGFWHRLLHATALLLLWSCLVGYLEHNQHIYSIVMTLQWGTPRVLQFLLGVSPILVGYALFGTIYFGNKMEEFGTISASMMTLFSLMNGDIIMDTFDAMEVHHFIVSGKVYLYSFISLFMYVVLNIFIAIVEEAFFASQSTRRRLTDYLSHPRVT